MKRPKDAQRLLLPLSHVHVLAGYLSPLYKAYFGRENYGLDLTDPTDPRIYAGAAGVVLAAGCDDSLGNTVIVRYEGVWNHRDERVMDVVLRYSHLSAITVAVGMEVETGDVLGILGCTAIADRGLLLHLEADADCEQPTYTPTLHSGGDFLQPGNRRQPTTLDPAALLHIGPGQCLGLLQPDWCRPEHFALPEVPRHEPGSSLSVFEKFESVLRATEEYLQPDEEDNE
jgi:murein DD-endopeptidase MepM/ murein hydrolase activator NlpD